MSEQNEVLTEEMASTMAVKKRCPYDATILVQIEDPDFGLCWSCPKCEYLEPVE